MRNWRGWITGTVWFNFPVWNTSEVWHGLPVCVCPCGKRVVLPGQVEAEKCMWGSTMRSSATHHGARHTQPQSACI